MVDVLRQIDAVPIKRSGEDHIAYPCFMAQYSREHKFRVSRKTHGWARICNNGESWAGCWVCDTKMPIVRLLRKACAKSPRFKPALKMAIDLEKNGGARFEPEIDLTYNPDDVDYTKLYYKKYRNNKKLLPWKWLKSKGVTGRGTKAFKIGVDIESGSIMLPCVTRDGKVVGAQSRSVAENSSENKYITTLKFNARDHLFGEHLLGTEGLLEPDEAALFEGPLDAVHAYEVGVNNTAACFGSSIRPGQAKLLRHREIDTIWLLLDPDVAGQEGIKKSKKVLRKYYPEAVIYTPKLPADPKEMTAEQYKSILTIGEDLWQRKGSRESLERLLSRLTSSDRRPTNS